MAFVAQKFDVFRGVVGPIAISVMTLRFRVSRASVAVLPFERVHSLRSADEGIVFHASLIIFLRRTFAVLFFFNVRISLKSMSGFWRWNIVILIAASLVITAFTSSTTI